MIFWCSRLRYCISLTENTAFRSRSVDLSAGNSFSAFESCNYLNVSFVFLMRGSSSRGSVCARADLCNACASVDTCSELRDLEIVIETADYRSEYPIIY